MRIDSLEKELSDLKMDKGDGLPVSPLKFAA